jgi:hypothetical protein
MKAFHIALLTSLLLFSLGSQMVAGQDQRVNRDELETAQGSVTFENNSGQSGVVNSALQIRAIGKNLAAAIFDARGGKRRNVRIGESARYSLVEAVDGGADGGLAADIIELGRNAGVDHIRNLRAIISGYLETSYHYSAADADELAIIITVYNAVNRQKSERFAEVYSKTVVARLDKNKVGLAASWREWAGQTQIIIPLVNPAGETYEISVETALTDEVKAAIAQEGLAIDAEKLLREQREREAAAEQAAREADEARRRAEAEQAARDALARKAADDAAAKVSATERSLAAALERARLEHERLIRYEEEVDMIRADAEKARRGVVRNRFGVPVAGNEAAQEMDNKLNNQQKLIDRQRVTLENARKELAELETALELAREAAKNTAGQL